MRNRRFRHLAILAHRHVLRVLRVSSHRLVLNWSNKGEVVGSLSVERPELAHIVNAGIRLAIVEATGVAESSDEVETIPSPVEAMNAFPLDVSVVGRERIRCRSRKLSLCRVCRASKLERIQPGRVGERREGAEGCRVDILDTEVDTICLDRSAVDERNEDAADETGIVTLNSFAREQAAREFTLQNVVRGGNHDNACAFDIPDINRQGETGDVLRRVDDTGGKGNRILGLQVRAAAEDDRRF